MALGRKKKSLTLESELEQSSISFLLCNLSSQPCFLGPQSRRGRFCIDWLILLLHCWPWVFSQTPSYANTLESVGEKGKGKPGSSPT